MTPQAPSPPSAPAPAPTSAPGAPTSAPAGPLRFTPAQLAHLLGARLEGRADLVLSAVAGLDEAGPAALTFIRSSRYASRWKSSRAGAALVTDGFEVPGHDPAQRALLFVPDADLAVIQLLRLAAPPPPAYAPGVHPTSVVSPQARLHPSVHIGPLCVVEEGAELAEGVVLVAQDFVGRGARLGPHTRLHAGVRVMERCVIGARCTLWPGVVIGADGFGYHTSPDHMTHTKIPHVGSVVIGDDVEIGANACVDRGKFDATSVGHHTKIDNLVQVGHNARVGNSVLLCGQVGLAGSAVIGDGTMLAGQVGVVDNIVVGPKSRVLAQSGVIRDVPGGQTWWGTPAVPAREQALNFRAMESLYRTLRDIRKELDQLRSAANLGVGSAARERPCYWAEGDDTRQARGPDDTGHEP